MDNSPETGFQILILMTLNQHNLVPNVLTPTIIAKLWNQHYLYLISYTKLSEFSYEKGSRSPKE